MSDTDTWDETVAVADTTAKRSKARPEFGLQVVGELPPQERNTSPNADLRINNELLKLVDDPEALGQWAIVVTYNTINGAKNAKAAIEDGKRIVPEGDWDFEVRRVNGEGGKRVSQLWARFNGA